MVKTISILALLASMAAAAPTLGNYGNLDVGVDAHVSIKASAGFTVGVSGALEACLSGAVSGAIDSTFKADLALWIKVSGKAYFDVLTIGEISKWCDAADYELTAKAKVALTAAFDIDAELKAAGGAIAFFNVDIKNAHGGHCLCDALETRHQKALLALLVGVKVGDLDAAVYASLKLSAAGGIAATLSVDALVSLKAYLATHESIIKGDLLVAVQAWISVGVVVDADVKVGAKVDADVEVGAKVNADVDVGVKADVDVDAKVDADVQLGGHKHSIVKANVVLVVDVQAKISAFISTSVFAGLSVEVKAGLKAAAAGGIAAALDVSVQAAITAWVKDTLALDVDLKATIALWISGQLGNGCEPGTAVDAFVYASLGLDIAANVEVVGVLSVDAQVSLAAFIKAHATIDATVLAALDVSAKGLLAASLNVDASVALSAWIASNDCSLSASLRGSILLWLSVGITGHGGAGVGIQGGAGLILDVDVIALISAHVNASVSLSSTVKGALAVALAGGVAASVEIEARAELVAFLLSHEGASLGVEVVAHLISWSSGIAQCDCQKA